MTSDELKIRRRNLPHWSLEGSVYFVTFRVAQGKLSDEELSMMQQHLIEGENRFYRLSAAVLMPDHVHLLIQPVPP